MSPPSCWATPARAAWVPRSRLSSCQVRRAPWAGHFQAVLGSSTPGHAPASAEGVAGGVGGTPHPRDGPLLTRRCCSLRPLGGAGYPSRAAPRHRGPRTVRSHPWRLRPGSTCTAHAPPGEQRPRGCADQRPLPLRPWVLAGRPPRDSSPRGGRGARSPGGSRRCAVAGRPLPTGRSIASPSPARAGTGRLSPKRGRRRSRARARRGALPPSCTPAAPAQTQRSTSCSNTHRPHAVKCAAQDHLVVPPPRPSPPFQPPRLTLSP